MISPIVIVHSIFGMAILTLLFRNYFTSVPEELLKAARVDGAGFRGIRFKIMLPMALPIFAAAIILRVTGIWNDFLFGVVSTKPAQLSGGQRQRVAIGRALVRDADVFLFDEPLSNLDARLPAELRVEIKRLHQKLGNTMIDVTHDQIEALTPTGRIAVMKGGTVQQLDDPLTIYNRPKNRYVAGFIGSPSMNFLKAELNGEALPSPALAGKTVALNGYVFAGPAASAAAVDSGVRPEHIRLNAAAGHSAAFDAVVELVEPMGSDSPVWLDLGGQPLSARVESSAMHKPGEKVRVSFRVGLASLFDAASGARL